MAVTIIKRKSMHKFIKDVPMVTEDLLGIYNIEDFIDNYGRIEQKLKDVFAESECFSLIKWIKNNHEFLVISDNFVVTFKGTNDHYLDLVKETMPDNLYKLLGV